MSQFYNKYRHLFINQEKPTNKSYLKPYMKQMNHRANSLNSIPGNDTKNQRSFHVDRFQTQILPEIQKLNKQAQNYRISSQITLPSMIYSPQPSNKNNINLIIKTQNNFNTLESPVLAKSPIEFKQKFYRQFKPIKNNFNSIKDFSNPQQEVKDQIQKKQNLKKNAKAKTEVSQQISRNIKLLPKIDQIRMNYGYPQVFNGIIFSQYQKQNQFKLINSRLKDIRWLEKYYPRGNLNLYREALVRRNESKKIISERRNRLKNLLQTQKKQFQKHQPII